MARSLSRACCRITTAAAASTTPPGGLRAQAGRTQAARGLDGGEPLVDQPDLDRRDPGGELGGVRSRGHRGRAVAAGQRSRQPDQHLDRVPLGNERGQLVEVVPAARVTA